MQYLHNNGKKPIKGLTMSFKIKSAFSIETHPLFTCICLQSKAKQAHLIPNEYSVRFFRESVTFQLFSSGMIFTLGIDLKSC